MPTYSGSALYPNGNYRLNVEGVTTAVTGGTLVEVYAVVTMITNPGTPAFGPAGQRSWSLTGNVYSDTAFSIPDASGSSTIPYDFSVTNPQVFYNYFNRYIPYGAASTTLSVTIASGTSSTFFTSRTVNVNVPLFQQPVSPPAAFTNTPYLTGRVNSSYSDYVVSVGATNITISGALPPGLNGAFSSTAGGAGNPGYVVSGTPTTAGTYSFTLTATNAGGSSTYNASITVNDIPAPGSFTNLPFPNAQRRVAYSYNTSSSNATSISVVSGSLPPGLNGSFSGTTWTLSGTPTTEGVYSFGLRASNAGPSTASTTVQVQVFPPPTFITPNVISRTQSAGTSTLTTAGFGTVTPTFITAGATATNNLIILSQTITSGTTAFVGDSIGIGVYDYRKTMPQLVTTPATSAASAIQILNAAEFTVLSPTLSTTGATLANNLTVRSQTQTAGVSYNISTNIQYVLYDYKIAVPKVDTALNPRDTAIQTLINAGFKNINLVLALPAAGATVANNGTVKSQNPLNSATTYNPANTTVTLEVYSLGVVGRRMTGSGTSSSLTTAKRFNGTSWVDITVAKRFNGTAWVDITNG